jgi:hypothetical protein
MNDTEGVLVSPLGLSPGAVSGVYFKLAERFAIRKVITLGTSDSQVISAANQYLAPLFAHQGIEYEPIHIPEPELRGGNRVVKPYVALWGLMLENARQQGRQVHVAVTAGRSGMGALAALAASLYGADYLWHFWVRQDIERQGALGQGALRPSLPPQMAQNLLLNPTLEPEACDIVALPFTNLRPLHPLIWQYRWTGALPDAPALPLDALLAWIKTDDFDHIFPAGITFAAAQQIMDCRRRYNEAPQDERSQYLQELGDLLQQRGVVNNAECERLVALLLDERQNCEELIALAKQSRDYTGFWNWMVANTAVIQATFYITTTLSATGLSPLLLKRLRMTLPNLQHFSNDINLRALFVDQRLKMWQHLLPEANNPYGRVNVTIDFLSESYNNAGENGLLLLLQVLLDQMDPDDANHRIITNLIKSTAGDTIQQVKQRQQDESFISTTIFFWNALQLYIRVTGRI